MSDKVAWVWTFLTVFYLISWIPKTRAYFNTFWKRLVFAAASVSLGAMMQYFLINPLILLVQRYS